MLSAPPVGVAANARTTGQIGIELPSGVRLTVDGAVARDQRAAAMIPQPTSPHILGVRHRLRAQGPHWSAVLMQQMLRENRHSGALFAFRGKRGDLIILPRFNGQGLCLFRSGVVTNIGRLKA